MSATDKIKSFDEEYIKITNSLIRSIADESISTFDINSFFRDIAIYAANQIANIKLATKLFGIDERQVASHKKGYDFLVNELDKMCSIVNDKPYEVINLSIFLVYWADENIFRHNYALLKQILLIESGISPQKAYDIINFKDTPLTLRKAYGLLIYRIIDKNEKLVNTNRSIKYNLQDIKDRLQKMEENAFSVLDPVTDLPNRSKALEILQTLIPKGVCVMIISVTNYKDMINIKGLDAANTALLAVINSIKELIRSDDMLFSTKKGELMLLLPKINETSAISIANLLLNRVPKDRSVMEKLKGYDKLSLNIGISISNRDSTIASMLQTADRNLKKSIHNGSNKFAI